MAKSKKRRKVENKKHQAMTPEHLIELGNSDIKSGNVRSAIAHYKQALKNKGNPSDIHILLFKAYLHHEKQLSDKGMFKEADAIRLNALEYKPEARALSEKELNLCLNAFPLDEGITFYNENFAANGTSPSVEKTIADKLLLSGNIELLNNIHDSSPLKTHCLDIQSAVYAMNEGNWKKALQHLKSIPRVSPWSETKLFCKAMASFLSDDDKTLARSISQLPDTSPFASTIRTLKLYADSENWNFLSDTHVAGNLLFEGYNDVFSQIDTLVKQLETDSASMAEPVILSLAARLCPKNPEEAARSLIEVIWQHCRVQSAGPQQYGEPTTKMFPHKEASLILLKAMFNYGPKVFFSGYELSERVGELFSDEREIAIAKSEIFTYIATRLQDDKHLLHEDNEGLAHIARIIGSEATLARYDHIEFCFSLIEHAVSIDPSNRAAYELAESCLSPHIKNKRLEALYEQMLVQFPHEPYPCLKLADIYDRKNAYRKSENILKEALKRAPHDNRVLERYALSFVIAAEKNMRLEKLHLVEADLSKAEAFNLPVHAEIIAEKKLLLQWLQDNNANPESLFDDCVLHYTNVQLFRIISLLIHDMRSKKLKTDTVTAYFKKVLKSNLKPISSLERASLLMPVGNMHTPAFSFFYVAELFLLNDKKYLEEIHDDHFINLLTTAGTIERSTLPHYKKNLGKRIKKAAGTSKTILEFGYAALKYIDGDEEMVQTLADLTNDAPSETLGQLKAVSTALAPLTEGDRRESLEQCDFTPLNPINMMPDLFNFDSPFGEMDEIDEIDEMNKIGPAIIGIMIFYMISLELIDKSSPKSAKKKLIGDTNQIVKMLQYEMLPYQMIVHSRNELLKTIRPLRGLMKNLTSLLDEELIGLLSEAAYTFLTGKKKPE